MRIDHPTVVAENFDGEQVVIHLGTGVYYALDRRGTLLWDQLEQGAQRDGLVDAFCAREGLDRVEAERTIDTFLCELANETLIVTGEGDAVHPPETPPTTPVVLSRFDDLADVLLVDPIHDLDLDGDGWPVDAGSGVGRPTTHDVDS